MAQTSTVAFDQLSRAARNRKQVRLTYESLHSSETRTFLCDPIQPVVAENGVFIDALTQPDERYKMLRVQRCLAVAITGEAGERPTYDFARRRRYMFRSWGPTTAQNDPVKVVLELWGTVALLVGEVFWHQTQQITPLGEGRIQIRFEVWHQDEVLWWSSRCGDECRIVAPVSLVARSRDWWRSGAKANAALSPRNTRPDDSQVSS